MGKGKLELLLTVFLSVQAGDTTPLLELPKDSVPSRQYISKFIVCDQERIQCPMSLPAK